MAIESSTFRYRIGDRIRSRYGAEYQIINIQTSSGTYGTTTDHYRLKPLSSIDNPFWLTSGIVYSNYEPCNPAIKILFDNARRSEGTKTLPAVNNSLNRGGVGGD